jgi:hypothetical protein
VPEHAASIPSQKLSIRGAEIPVGPVVDSADDGGCLSVPRCLVTVNDPFA